MSRRNRGAARPARWSESLARGAIACAVVALTAWVAWGVGEGDAEAAKKRKKKKAKPAPAKVAPKPSPEKVPPPDDADVPPANVLPETEPTPDPAPVAAETTPDQGTPSASSGVGGLIPQASDNWLSQRAPSLTAAVAMEAGGRRFAYNDALTANLRGYQVPLVPLAAVDLAWYPTFARGAGLTVRYERAFALESQTSDGASVPTTWDRLDAGARMRFRTRRSGPVLALAAGYGRHAFT